MVSEHASPLAALGGVDAGGQNVHVAALARRCAAGGTRSRSTPAGTARTCPSACRSRAGVDRGPRAGRAAAADAQGRRCCRYMPRFGRWLARDWAGADAAGRRARPLLDVRPGRAARRRGARGIPVVADLPRAGHGEAAPPGRGRHQPAASASRCEARVAPRRRPGHRHLHRRGARAGAAGRRRERACTSCRAVSTPAHFSPTGPADRAGRGRAPARSPSAGSSSARASTRRSGRWPRCRASSCVVAGGPPARRARTPTPRPAGCARLAARARRRRPGAAPRPGAAAADCPPCCARPTSCCPCPGTSRSASSRWRPWPAACPVVGVGRRRPARHRRRRRHRVLVPPRDPAALGDAVARPARPTRRAASALRARRGRPRAVPSATTGAGRAPPPRTSTRRVAGGARRVERAADDRSSAPLAGERPPPQLRRAALRPLARPGRRSSSAGARGWPTSSPAAAGCSPPATAAAPREAQHLTAELVGRFRDDRRPLSAIALCAETSSLTAIVNDYGVEEMFARQVRRTAGRATCSCCCRRSGRSRNVLPPPSAAATAACRSGR